MTIDITKITPEKLAEMNDSLMVDNNHLRGQLATMTEDRDACMRDYGEEQDRKRKVAKQRSDHIKREMMLRDALTESRRELDSCQKVIWLASDYGFDPAYVKGAQASIRKTDEAIAATADLKDVRLCHAEPDSYKYKHHDSFGVGFFWSHRPTHQGSAALESVPLYRAWEPKEDNNGN